MSRKPVDRILSAAEQIAHVWTENPTFAMSDLTLAQYQTMITNLRARRSQAEELRTQLTAVVNDTNSQAQAVSDVITRARSGFRAFFGPTPRNTNRPAALEGANANARPVRPTTRFRPTVKALSAPIRVPGAKAEEAQGELSLSPFTGGS